jgi:pimeloyl-ACP methyl ester carboxylesterase
MKPHAWGERSKSAKNERLPAILFCSRTTTCLPARNSRSPSRNCAWPKGIAVNAPHPAAYRRTRRCNPRQWLRSWFVLFFQLPELLIRSRDFALLERGWKKDPVTPGAYSTEDLARYKEALRQPGALTATINYYRVALRWPRDLYGEPQSVSAPTLLVWGEQDRYLGLDLTEGLEALVPELQIERIAEASRWVQNDVADVVNRLLIDFLAG